LSSLTFQVVLVVVVAGVLALGGVLFDVGVVVVFVFDDEAARRTGGVVIVAVIGARSALILIWVRVFHDVLLGLVVVVAVLDKAENAGRQLANEFMVDARCCRPDVVVADRAPEAVPVAGDGPVDGTVLGADGFVSDVHGNHSPLPLSVTYIERITSAATIAGLKQMARKTFMAHLGRWVCGRG
jgi:hypothetical protein